MLTAWEDGAAAFSDPDLLDRASALGRVLVTQDDGLPAEATRRQADGLHFSGVVYAHQLRVSIGKFVQDLDLIATTGEREDLRDYVMYPPL